MSKKKTMIKKVITIWCNNRVQPCSKTPCYACACE